MPKLITLVEDELSALKTKALQLIHEAESLVEKLIHHGHPDAAKPDSLLAASNDLKTHLENKNVLLNVPDISPTPSATSTPPPLPPAATVTPNPEVAPVGAAPQAIEVTAPPVASFKA